MAERNGHVGKGQRTACRRHEGFTLHHEQQVEHVLVQYVPRTDLLFHHVEARLFDIHVPVPTKKP